MNNFVIDIEKTGSDASMKGKFLNKKLEQKNIFVELGIKEISQDSGLEVSLN